MNSHIKSLLKKHQFYLIVIFFLAFILRIYNFPDRMRWYGDTAADMIAGYHYVYFKEIPVTGPYASGLVDIFYPPYYYYFVGLLTFIFKDPVNIGSFMATVFSLGVFPMYIFGKYLKNVKTGLISALIYATANSAVLQSLEFWSVSFAYLMLLFSSMLFVLGLQKSNSFLKYFSYFCFCLTASINFAVLFYIPFFWIIEYFYEHSFTKLLKSVILTVFSFEMLILPSASFINISDFISAKYINQVINLSPLDNERINLPLNMFIGRLNGIPNMFNIALLSISILILLNYVLKHNSVNKILLLIIFLLSIFAISVFKNGNIFPQYYSFYYPLIFVISAYIITQSMSLKLVKIFRIIITTICIFLIIYLMNPSGYTWQNDQERVNSLQIAGIINSEIKNNNLLTPNNFSLMVSSSKNIYWDNSTIWYYLEKITNKQYLLVYTGNVNMRHIFKPSYYFLICHDYGNKQKCLSEFMKKYTGSSVVKEINNHLGYDIFLLKLLDSSNI